MRTFSITLSAFLWAGTILAQSFNMNLESNWDDNTLPSGSGLVYNDCWGYNAPNGTEVAILGTLQRIYFFDVTDPTDPQIIDFFTVTNANGTTNTSIWRDFKTYDHYAYACADQVTSGLLIFDLSDVPNSVSLVTQTQEFFNASHNIWIDVATGRLYTAGANSNSAGTIILDLTVDPEDPVLLSEPVFPYGYAHDIHVVNNLGFACHGPVQKLGIYDFTNPTAISLVNTLENYPEPGYNHSAWLDDSGNRLVFADETHGQALKLCNPNLAEHQTSNYHLFQSQLLPNNSNSIAHNPFIKEDLCFVAYYHDGVQVFNIADTNNITNVAYYDTYSNTNYGGYEGCWGVYPYLESGNIIASDISNGLFMLSMTGGVLPLDFIAFDAAKQDRDVRLSWKVTNPEDGETFFVEHSRDGGIYETLEQQTARHGQLNYQAQHRDPGPGPHFYRITVRHLDGSKMSTSMRYLEFDLDAALDIRPSIVSDRLTIDVRDAGDIRILSADGKLMTSRTSGSLERIEMELGSLPSGTYYVVWQAGSAILTEPFTKL